METSRYHHPGTSERSRRGQGTILIVHERQALPGPQEAGIVVRSYERFLEMPVQIVLAVMWVAGAALLGSCALTLYVLGSLLLQYLN
jgi:hypothetical protein